MNKGFYLIYIFLVLCFLGCTKSKDNRGEAYNYLGENAAIVLKVTDFGQLKTDLKTNRVLQKTQHPVLAFISTSEIVSNLNLQGPLYFSAIPNRENIDIVFTKAVDTISFTIDSIPDISVEKNTINKRVVKKIVLKKDSLFTAIKDSVAVFSTSKNELLAILEQKENVLDKQTKKLLDISKEADVAEINSTQLYPNRLSQGKDINASKSLHIQPDGIQVSGIIKSKDSSLIAVFNGQSPQISTVTSILPSSFYFANGFTFTDAPQLINQLKKQKQDTTATDVHPFIETLTEITETELKEGKALLMSSIDMEQSFASIELDISTLEAYRDITIYKNNFYQLIASAFNPLVSDTEYPYLLLLDNHVVCTNTLGAAKEIIGKYQNKNVLENTDYFKTLNTQMLSTTSLYSLGQSAAVAKMISAVLQTEISVTTTKKYPLAALQYSYEKNFAHLNFVTKEINITEQLSGTVNQKFSVVLDQPILGSPQFFTNHRTGGKDVLAQDITATLHLFSINGKKLWSKKLDSPIVGEIKEIDLLRNGKKQLAFATQKTFYVLDRNGKEVGPFPLKFKDDITQPLAVFDYDKNRKYRFIITQGNGLLMYDSKGKIVKGFAFKKTKTPLLFAPEHFRIGNKDFIVLGEENGKATFLSRTGKERIKVSETFKFGETPIQKEGARFVIISEDKKKHKISTTGKLTSENLVVSDTYFYKSIGNKAVTLDDNLARINGLLIELPFGIYSEPQLINHKNNTYFSITDLQEHQVYVYDKNRKLVDGFPVFGTTTAHLGSQGKKLVVVTTGSDKEVLCYQAD